MVDPQPVTVRSRVERVQRKADQQTTAHAYLRDSYSFRHAALTTVSLVSGLFLLAMIMASASLASSTLGLSPGEFQWILALVAIASFSTVVLILAWRYDVRAERHDQAVRHYTKAAYVASRLLIRAEPATEADLDRLEELYLDDRDLPRIPEKLFLRLKQWHLLKVEASKELSRNPHQSIPDLLAKGPPGGSG